MTTPLRVGDILYGFCGGRFGRDSYTDKRVEAIGSDWVVAREQREDYSWNPEGWPTALIYHGDPEKLIEYREKPEEEE